LATLPFETLDRIAILTSRNAVASQREDVYAACWIRFLTYDPRVPAGAWLMASSARNDVYRREAYQSKVKAAAPPEGYQEDVDSDLDDELALIAQDELMAFVREAADPEQLVLLDSNVNGRRRLTPERLEALRTEILAAVKAKANGQLVGLVERSFR
jgi:hypothetical protein